MFEKIAVLIPSGERQVILRGIRSTAIDVSRTEWREFFKSRPQAAIIRMTANDQILLMNDFSFALDHEMKQHISYTRTTAQRMIRTTVKKVLMINTSVIKNMSHLVAFRF